jgi:hypothetical protein
MAATPESRWIKFLRNYGPIPTNDNMYDETIQRALPAREISFQEQNLKAMFDEVHGLAEWVATYDDLLDKRQLMAQGISVIPSLK